MKPLDQKILIRRIESASGLVVESCERLLKALSDHPDSILSDRQGTVITARRMLLEIADESIEQLKSRIRK